MTRSIISNRRGGIAYAKSTDDGRPWSYEGTAWKARHHLSYPFVIWYDKQPRMIRETQEDHSIEFYSTVRFPLGWQVKLVLFAGAKYVDATVFQHEEKWWMFYFLADQQDPQWLHITDVLEGP